MQVAARFATNWLQIWHFNPTIMHPDSALPPNILINIGHLYEVLLFLILATCRRHFRHFI